MVPTKRSAKALARGARTGVRMIRMPSVRKTSSKAAVNLVSRSPDQELDALSALAEFVRDVPRLLDHPGSRRVVRDAGDVHLSGVELDEEEDVQLLQEHGVDGEEVAGQHRRGLGLQELLPRRPSSLRGGIKAVALKDVPDAGGGQVDTDP